MREKYEKVFGGYSAALSGCLCVFGFAEEEQEFVIFNALYLSEHYLLVELTDAYEPTESDGKINVTYKSGKTETFSEVSSADKLKAGTYNLIESEIQNPFYTLVLLELSEGYSDDTAEKVSIQAGMFSSNGTLNPTYEHKINFPSIRNNIISIVTSTENFADIDPEYAYPGCYADVCIFAGFGEICNCYRVDILGKDGQNMSPGFKTANDEISTYFRLGDDCEFTVCVSFLGEEVRKETFTYRTKAEVKKAVAGELLGNVGDNTIGRIGDILLAPLVFLMSFNPIFALFIGGPVGAVITVFKALFESTGSFFESVGNSLGILFS